MENNTTFNIEFKNVQVRNHTDFKLKNVSLNLTPGCYALCSYSGGGKSLIRRIIAGIVKPTFGTIKLNNISYKDICWTSQSEHLPHHLTVSEYLEVICMLRWQKKDRKQKVNSIAKKLSISNKMLKTKTKELDVFSTRKCILASKLILEPKVFISDELYGSMSYQEGSKLVKLTKDYVEDNNLIWLDSTHLTCDILTMDKTLYIENGYIYDDSSDKFKKWLYAESNLLQCLKTKNYEHILST